MNLEREQPSPSGQLYKCTLPMPSLAVICCSRFTSPDYKVWSTLYVTTAYESAHYFPVLTQLPSEHTRAGNRLCELAELANQKLIYLKLFSWACRNQYLSRATLKITAHDYQRSLRNLYSAQVTCIRRTALMLHVQKGKERQKNCLSWEIRLVYIFPTN